MVSQDNIDGTGGNGSGGGGGGIYVEKSAGNMAASGVRQDLANFSRRLDETNYNGEESSDEEEGYMRDMNQDRTKWGGGTHRPDGFSTNRKGAAGGGGKKGASSGGKNMLGHNRTKSVLSGRSGGAGGLGGFEDKYVMHNNCLRPVHMPYFRDIENVALSSLRQLDAHEVNYTNCYCVYLLYII